MSRQSDRHWYPRYPGDYARKTAHLSLAEHGAYALLMDWYYSNGKPLPDDWVQMHRICKAIAPDEQQAVQSIVQQFFVQSGAGWSNSRADEEIAKKADISEKRRDAQRIRENRRCKPSSNDRAKGGANAPSFAHTTTSTTTLGNSNELPHTSDSAPTPAKPKPAYPPAFEQLWSIWPRHEGKRNALKAYEQATRRGTHDEIIGGCTAIANAHRNCATPDRFIPHLATWLNRDGWLDDPAAIRSRNDAQGDAAQPRRGAGSTAMVAGHAVLQDIREGRTRY